MKLKATFIFFIFFCCGNIFSQQKKIDSLLKVLPQRTDTARLKVLVKLANYFKKVSLDSAIKFANAALVESRKIKSVKYEYDAVYKLADYWREKGEFVKSLDFLNRSLEIGKMQNDTQGMAQTYNSIGITYFKMGNYPLALAYYQKSLFLKEKRGDKKGMSNAYINIGSIYQSMSLLDKAEEYILKGAKLKEEIGDNYGVAGALNNLCIIYKRTRRSEKAVSVLESVQKKYKEYLDPYLETAVLGNLAEAYQSTGQLKKASESARECLRIREELGDSIEVSYTLLTVANIELENKNYEAAIKYTKRTIQMAKNMGMLSHLWDAYITLGETYRAKGDYKNAAEYFGEVIKLSDTLINSRAFTVIHDMEIKYETTKKEAQILALNNQQKIQELELDRQEANIGRQRWIMIFGLLVILGMVAVSIMIYRGYRQKKKSNEKIQAAYSLIEEKQKEILDSIHYAKRIQNSLLPSEKYIVKSLNRLRNKKN